METVKSFVDALVDNLDTLPEFSQYLIGLLCRNYITTPPFYYIRFEINRLNFSEKGGLMYEYHSD